MESILRCVPLFEDDRNGPLKCPRESPRTDRINFFDVVDVPDAQGVMFELPEIPADTLSSPHPNEETARYAKWWRSATCLVCDLFF